MELNQLLDTVTESIDRPQGREAHVGAALFLCHREIDRCGIEVTRAYSYKGTLSLEIERGPICKLEIENWQRLLQNISSLWNEVTGYEVIAEFRAADGWLAQEVAEERAPDVF